MIAPWRYRRLMREASADVIEMADAAQEMVAAIEGLLTLLEDAPEPQIRGAVRKIRQSQARARERQGARRDQAAA